MVHDAVHHGRGHLSSPKTGASHLRTRGWSQNTINRVCRPETPEEQPRPVGVERGGSPCLLMIRAGARRAG